jgi:hypothetical protein
MLTPRGHSDLADLDAVVAATFGPLIVDIEHALSAALDGVGRVHVNRWGDGGAHLHWWFLVRPVGLLQLRGSQLASWLDVLPALPSDLVAADTSRVVAELRRRRA